MDIDFSALFNGLAGLGALVIALTLRPAVRDLKSIVTRQDERMDGHGERISRLEAVT